MNRPDPCPHCGETSCWASDEDGDPMCIMCGFVDVAPPHELANNRSTERSLRLIDGLERKSEEARRFARWRNRQSTINQVRGERLGDKVVQEGDWP